MKDLGIYGIGNAIMDLQVQVSDDSISSLGLEKGGMQLVDTSRQKELVEFFHGAEIVQRSGGSAANTIIALAQLGVSAGYACTFGSDKFGTFYSNEMKELGVELHTAPQEEATGTCFILITPDAERTMNTTLGASALFAAEHLSKEHIERAEWIYIEGYLFSSEAGCQAAIQAAEFAKTCGTKVAVTFSDAFIVNCFREPLEQVVSMSDLVFANEVEAQAFTGKEQEDEVFEAMKSAAPNVVMTQHDKGARASWQGTDCFVPAFEIMAIDATGAGDMFAAGYLYGVLKGLSVEQSVRVANFLASKVVSQLGARLDADVKQLLVMNDLAPAAV